MRLFLWVSLVIWSFHLQSQDNCNSAVDLNSELGPFDLCDSYVGSYTTTGFTPEPDLASLACDYEINPTVWFVIDPPSGALDMTITIDGGTLPDPTVGIFLENGCNPPYAQSGPFSGCNNNPASYTTLVNETSLYYIVVSSSSGSGSFDINISFTGGGPPSNDFCSGSIQLTQGIFALNQTNECATTDNNNNCDDDASVWYDIVITQTSTISVVMNEITIVNTAIAIYDGCMGPQVDEGNCNESAMTDCLPPGNYFIEVSTAAGNEGTFNILAIFALCGGTCSIDDAGLEGITCNNNGTPSDPSDDFIEFTLNPTGTDIGTSYNVIPSGGSITPANALYGSSTSFAMNAGSAGGGNFTITIVDFDDPTCSLTITINDPGTCSNECEIVSFDIFNIDCLDPGTPNDSSDDIIVFEGLAEGFNVSFQYNIFASAGLISPSFGTYGNTFLYSLGLGSAILGDITVTIEDQNDPSCTFEVVIENPGPCSIPCEIDEANLTNVECNNNGTPSDSSDDFISFDLNPTGTSLSANYLVSVPGFIVAPNSSAYGNTTSFSLSAGSAGVGDLTIIITDENNPGCTLEIVLIDPGNCSSDCTIDAAGLSDILCFDNNSPSDPNDDIITFELDPNGVNIGTNYSVTITGLMVTPNSVPYGVSTIFSLPPGSAGGGDLTITITDENNPNCTFDIILIDPGICSSADCTLDDLDLANILCDDNDSPTDPTDDVITFELNPIGTNLGSNYSIVVTGSSVTPSIASYGAVTLFSLDTGSAGNGDLIITITDVDNPDCIISTTLTDPGICSSLECLLTNELLENVECNDNGTNQDPTDDFVTFELTVDGLNIGPSYTVDVGGFIVIPISGTYGIATSFSLSQGSAGNPNTNITVTDVDDPGCTLTLDLIIPATCSDSCSIDSIQIVDLLCNDNGTGNDENDDYITFDISIFGTNTSDSLQFNILETNNIDTIINGQTLSIVTDDGSALLDSFTIIVYDIDNTSCIDTFTVVSPGPCSSSCSIENIEILEIGCDNQGTSTVDDDLIFIVFEVVGTNVGDQYYYQIGSVLDSAIYNASETIMLNYSSIQGGGDLLLTITDENEESCTLTLEIPEPTACSSGCSIDMIEISNILCNDNGTPFDDSDDFVSFDISVTGENVSSFFDIYIDGSSLAAMQAYNNLISFSLPAGSALLGDFIIEVVDAQHSDCSLTDLLVNPGPCSSSCFINPITPFEVICNDNGTPFDSSDDYITLILNVSGNNLGSGYSIVTNQGSIFPSTGAYDVGIDFQLDFGSAGAGDVTITVTDLDNPSCQETVEILDPGNCSSECNFIIDAGKDQKIDCNFPETTITAIYEANGVISWLDSNGMVISSNDDLIVDTEGTYYISVDYGDGCVLMDSVNVVGDFTEPIVDLGNDTLLNCIVILIGFQSANYQFDHSLSWSFNNQITTDSDYLVSHPGVLQLEVINEENGCIGNDEVVITQDTLSPSAVIYADPLNVIDCFVESIDLSTDNEDNVMYQWTFSDEIIIAPSVEISESGNINLIALDTINGCSSFNQIIIESQIQYPIISLSSLDALCEDENIIIDASNSQLGESIIHVWTDINGNDLEIDEYTFSTQEAGTYIFQLTDESNGCQNSDTITVDANFEEFPTYNIDQIIDGNQYQFSLTSQDSLIAVWFINDQEACLDCATFNHAGTNGDIIQVLLTDENGCTELLSYEIEDIKKEEVFIPNIFSPNGDGVNDNFVITGPSDLPVIKYRIYDRWGNLIFVRDNLLLGDQLMIWDGTYKGEVLNPAVFVYYLQTIEQDYYGDVTIFR